MNRSDYHPKNFMAAAATFMLLGLAASVEGATTSSYADSHATAQGKAPLHLVNNFAEHGSSHSASTHSSVSSVHVSSISSISSASIHVSSETSLHLDTSESHEGRLGLCRCETNAIHFVETNIADPYDYSIGQNFVIASPFVSFLGDDPNVFANEFKWKVRNEFGLLRYIFENTAEIIGNFDTLFPGYYDFPTTAEQLELWLASEAEGLDPEEWETW